MPKSLNCLFCVIDKKLPISRNSQRFAKSLKNLHIFRDVDSQTLDSGL